MPLVALVVDHELHRLSRLVALLLAGAVVAAVSKWPTRALVVLVAVLPFQLLLLAAAYRYGLPASATRQVGYWIELVVAGCALAAVRQVARSTRRPDAIDTLGLIYVFVTVLYRLLPHIFVHPTGIDALGPPTGASVLNTALRNDTVFVVLFLAVRHLPLDEAFRRRLARVVLVTGAIVAVVGLYEFARSSSWNHFCISTLHLTDYQTNVLKVPVLNPSDIRVYTTVGGRQILRTGSVFVDELACGYYLLLASAVAFERVVRSSRRRGLNVAILAVVLAALLTTQTRSAILGVAVVAYLALRPSTGRLAVLRVRTALLLASLVVLLAIPFGLRIGLGSRAVNNQGSTNSTQVHIDRTTAAVRQDLSRPLGAGLASAGGDAVRFGVAGGTQTEDYYLQIGAETGLITLISFATLSVAANRRLRRVALGHPDLLQASWRGAFLALSLVGLIANVWQSLVVSLPVWAGLGAALKARVADSGPTVPTALRRTSRGPV